MKEIIIDGVDVAGCDYMYDNEDLNYMCQNGIGTCICRENKNCYYKQLKRLEQENAELEQTLQEIKKIAEIKIDCKQYEIDHDCFNDTRCKALRELIETLQEILAIITKAEVGE